MTYSQETVLLLYRNDKVERELKVLVEGEIFVTPANDPYRGCPGGIEIDWMSIYDQRGNDITDKVLKKYPRCYSSCEQEVMDYCIDYGDYLESFDPRYDR